MHENTLVMFSVKNSIYHMAYEQFQFKLTSDMNVLCYVFMSFGKHMTDYQTIGLLKLTELLCFMVEMLWLEFRNGKFW